MNETMERLLYDALDLDIPEIHDKSDDILQQQQSETVFVAGASGMISGIDVLRRIVDIVDDTLHVKVLNGNGSLVDEGDIIAIISGSTVSQLKVLPTVTNYLSKMSGYATASYQYIKQLANDAIKLYESTDGTPLFRPFEQLAFQHAGGHSFAQEFPRTLRLSKPHYEQCGSVTQAVTQLLETIDHYVLIIAEVRTVNEYMDAIESNCDMIVMHSMTLGDVQECMSKPAFDKSTFYQGEVPLSWLQTLKQTEIDGILISLKSEDLPIQSIRNRLDDLL